MTRSLNSTRLLSALLLSSASGVIFAQSAYALGGEDSGAYATIGLTQASADLDLSDLSAAGTTIDLGQQSAKITTLTGRLGYKLAKFIAIEGEAGLGLGGDTLQQSIPVDITGVGSINVDTTADLDITNYAGVFARGILPVGDQFEIFARAGYGYAKAEASAVGTTAALPGFSASAAESDSINDFAYGVGAQFNLTDRHGIRLDYSRISSDFDIVSVSYAINF